MLLPFILMFVVMYFLILRPQKRKEKERKALLARVKKTTGLVTAGGIHGLVTSVREHEVILRIDDAKDIKIKVDRSAIVTVAEVSHDDETEETTCLCKEIKKRSKVSLLFMKLAVYHTQRKGSRLRRKK
jgi:preprotein translocase, YajC subunit